MIKWILKILKNEDGFLVPALMAGAGAILGATAGKNKQQTIDPYAKLRTQYQDYLSGKLGTSTPYEYNESFTTQQPEVEKAVESTILGKLGNLPKVRNDIQDISNRYYNAQKSQMQDRFAEEQEAQKNMYNRLGLSSSTPGLAASTKLGRQQEQELGVLSADIARQGIDQEMRATELAEQIANQYLSQGQQLGQLQRGYEQVAQRLSLEDLQRMTQEEQGYAQLANTLLGGNPPQYYYEPNIWSQIGSAAQNIGTTLLGGNILGNTGSTMGTSSGTSAGIGGAGGVNQLTMEEILALLNASNSPILGRG